MAPRMIVVAGPPRERQVVSLYPLSSFKDEYFNADDRAAELNGGSYIGVTPVSAMQGRPLWISGDLSISVPISMSNTETSPDRPNTIRRCCPTRLSN